MCEKFFSLLEWVVERKDFEDFWPVGLESTGVRYWSQLLTDVERVMKTENKLGVSDYPTANLALVFGLIYGIREMKWSSERCISLLDDIFFDTQKYKYGDIFNSDGSNLIWEIDSVVQKFEQGTQLLEIGVSAQDVNELSGLILALAESEYFMNHRIATEKHGGYRTSDDCVYVVRSFKNLCPTDLWPQLKATMLCNKEHHLIFKYNSFDEIRFDVMSNLITPLPPLNSLQAVSLSCNEEKWDLSRFKNFCDDVRHGIYLIGDELTSMGWQQKAERLTEILYFGCRESITSWKSAAQKAIEVGRSHSVRYPVPRYGDERFKYYNLTQGL